MRMFIVLILVILLCSCAETTINYYKPAVDSWKGGNSKELLSRWGKPNQKITSYNGNTVYIYRQKGYVEIKRNEPHRFFDSFFAPEENENKKLSVVCVTAFESDKSGSIVHVQSQGHGCYANKESALQKTNQDR